jgi:hypothetical protein
VCPRLMISGFATAIQHLHKVTLPRVDWSHSLPSLMEVPPKEHLADQLHAAYDCYLSIQREVAELTKNVLNRKVSDEAYSLLCPPCFYRVENEPTLVPSILAAMDSNNSLKCVDTAY